MTLDWTLIDSPLGPLSLGANPRGLAAVRFGRHPEATTSPSPAARQLREYFAGTRRDFDLPLAPEGTEFRQRVWNALRSIPYGETRTYRDIAAQVGAPRGMQAVGQANRHNRIPIVIPCHRVVAVDSIGGYAGEGAGGKTTDTKRWLLRHEGVAV